LEITHLPLPTTDVAIVVCDSRVKHDLAASEYNLRRTECELGVALLRPYLPGIQALRDVSVEALQRHVSRLPATLARRCRHVVTENERTLAAAEALRLGHWETLGRLMNASHESLRDDYEVSCAELDLLVQTAQQLEGVLGARMTGGGFGGCTVNLVRAAAVAQFSATLAREYQRSTGLQPSVYQIRAGAGAAELLAKAA
jgi:galactokinase